MAGTGCASCGLEHPPAAERLPEERRQVTVLFADPSGYGCGGAHGRGGREGSRRSLPAPAGRGGRTRPLRGLLRRRERDLEGAIGRFLRAHELAEPVRVVGACPPVALGLSLCLRDLGRHADAVTALALAVDVWALVPA